jgi:tetratricopeptide (TPR) repeat protein
MTATTIIDAQIVIACTSIPLGMAYAFAMGRAKVVRIIQIAALALSVLFVCSAAVAMAYVNRRVSITEAEIAENPQEAVKILTDALRVDGASSTALFKRGIAYLKLNDPQHAYLDLQKASEGAHWNAVQLKDLAKAARQTGNAGDALAVLNLVISREPHDFDALTARGITEMGLGDATAALSDFEAALAAANSDEMRFYSHMNVASALMALRRDDDAIKHLTTALSIHPDNPQTLGELAGAYGGAVFHGGHGSHEKALEFANRALLVDPSSDVAGLAKAAALFYLGDRQGGIAELSSVIERHPNEAPLLFERAHMYVEMGNSELAIADLQAAQKIANSGQELTFALMERPQGT